MFGIPPPKPFEPNHENTDSTVDDIQKRMKKYNEKIQSSLRRSSSQDVYNVKEIEQSEKSETNFKRYVTHTIPTIIRLEYKTQYSKEKGGNIAYCITRKNPIENELSKYKKEAEYNDNLSRICTLNINTIGKNTDFSVTKMCGLSLEPYEFYAQQIVDYLLKYHKFPLRLLVCDFMKDERDIIYFLGVIAFRTEWDPEDDNKKQKLPELSKLEKKEIDSRNKLRKYKTWKCRMCLLEYPQDKVTKIVTFKLLFKLKENLMKRNVNCFEHIVKNSHNEKQSCRICDLCYILLVTEQQIMEVQKAIAVCNNIPVPIDDFVETGKKAPKNLFKLIENVSFVNQWRILFYFVRFYNFNYFKFPFADGTQVKSNLSPEEKKNGKTNYKLVIKIFKQQIELPIFTEMKDFTKKDEVELNVSKIIYFFTPTENCNVREILKKEQIEFKIVLNDKYNDPIGSCLTKCFSCFEECGKVPTITSKNVLNFFSDYVPNFKCQAHIGVQMDNKIHSNDMNLYAYYNYDNKEKIYLTDNDYYSFDPLPPDWYELFKSNDTINSNQDDDLDIKIENITNSIVASLSNTGSKRKHLKDKNSKDLFTLLVNEQKKDKQSNVENDEDNVYDPYDLLVEIQKKNEAINKIESIPILIDKNFVDMKLESKKERPKTSKLSAKFKFTHDDINNANKTSIFVKKDFDSKIITNFQDDFLIKLKNEEKIKEKERELKKLKDMENVKKIYYMNHDELEKQLDNTDDLLSKLENDQY